MKNTDWLFGDEPIPKHICDNPFCTHSMVKILFHEKNRSVYKACFGCFEARAVKKSDWFEEVSGAFVEFQQARENHFKEIREAKKAEYEIQRRLFEKRQSHAQEFYNSYEWFRLRYKVLLKYDRRCMCCGASGPGVRLHVDHIKPRSKFPSLALDENNLQVLCADCNFGKSNVDFTDFRDCQNPKSLFDVDLESIINERKIKPD